MTATAVSTGRAAARLGRLVGGITALAGLALSGCAAFPVVDVPSTNQNSRVQHLVLHFTSEDFARSLELLTEPSSNPVSAHWLVPDPRDASYPHGSVRLYRLVGEDRRAWHAGQSAWAGVTALNDSSIGIEIVNRSACTAAPGAADPPAPEDLDCRFEPYDPRQIDAVIALARAILERHPDIDPQDVIGHADIAPTRRVDPGPLFPWARLAEAGVGAWPEAERVAAWRAYVDGAPLTVRQAQRALAAWGLPVEVTGEEDAASRHAVRAFQMHFLPRRVTGRADPATQAVLLALLERYRPDRLVDVLGAGGAAPALRAPPPALQQPVETEFQQAAGPGHGWPGRRSATASR